MNGFFELRYQVCGNGKTRLFAFPSFGWRPDCWRLESTTTGGWEMAIDANVVTWGRLTAVVAVGGAGVVLCLAKLVGGRIGGGEWI